MSFPEASVVASIINYKNFDGNLIQKRREMLIISDCGGFTVVQYRTCCCGCSHFQA